MKTKIVTKAVAVSLSLSVAFTGAGFTASGFFAPLATVAASTSDSPDAYDRFNEYLSRPASPSSLSSARKVLVDDAKTFGISRATLAVLKLENAQKAYLSQAQARIGSTEIQKAIADVYEPVMTLREVRLAVSGKAAQQALQELEAVPYKLETGEGMFYPVMSYKEYKVFKTYVKPDIVSYIDLMARESENPPTGDAALLISWDDVARRAVDFESFLTKHKVSNRTAAMQERFKWAKLSVFYGQSNAPLFDYQTSVIDPEAWAAYKQVLASKNASEIAASSVLKHLNRLDELLEQTDGKRTQIIDDYLKKNVPVNG